MKITVKRLDRLRAGQSISDTGLFARRQSEGGCHREEDRVDEDRNAVCSQDALRQGGPYSGNVCADSPQVMLRVELARILPDV